MLRSVGEGRGGGGAADDEAGGDEELALQAGFAGVFGVDAESFKGGACEVGAGEADGGERRQSEFREVDVVESDDGEVLGYAEALEVGRAKDTDCGHVVGAENGGWLSGERLEFTEADHAAFQGVIALDDPFLLDGKFLGAHRIFKVVLTRDGGMKLVRTSEETDLGMSDGCEVMDR